MVVPRCSLCPGETADVARNRRTEIELIQVLQRHELWRQSVLQRLRLAGTSTIRSNKDDLDEVLSDVPARRLEYKSDSLGGDLESRFFSYFTACTCGSAFTWRWCSPREDPGVIARTLTE